MNIKTIILKIDNSDSEDQVHQKLKEPLKVFENYELEISGKSKTIRDKKSLSFERRTK